jgi:hypothetical protein
MDWITDDFGYYFFGPGMAISKMGNEYARGSNAFQVFNQILLVFVAEVQVELRIVVVHHVEQRGKAPVVKEATRLMRP